MGRRNGAVLSAVLALFALTVSAAPAPAATWSPHQLRGEAAEMIMFGVSCPTTSLCVATGAGNTIATSADPGGGADWDIAFVGAGAVSTPGNAFSPGRQIRGVDCISPSLCVAVSFEGLIYTSTNPTGGASAWTASDLDGPGPNTHLYGVSCPSPTFCAAAAGKGRIATTTNPLGGSGAWSVAELGESLELRGVSCPSPSLCVVVGNEGKVLVSTDPLGGAATWTQAQLAGAPIDRNLYGVSCPSPNLCVSGDTVGQLLLSTAPTGGASSWNPTQGGGTVQLDRCRLSFADPVRRCR